MKNILYFFLMIIFSFSLHNCMEREIEMTYTNPPYDHSEHHHHDDDDDDHHNNNGNTGGNSNNSNTDGNDNGNTDGNSNSSNTDGNDNGNTGGNSNGSNTDGNGDGNTGGNSNSSNTDGNDNGVDNGNNDANNEEPLNDEWKGEMLNAKSSCNGVGEYEIELKIKDYNRQTSGVVGEMKISNKWLRDDKVKFYFKGTYSKGILKISTFEKYEEKRKTCSWCAVNNFTFNLENNRLKGKWEGDECNNKGYNEKNTITLRED